MLHPEEINYFLSNAPAETPVAALLRVAFSRWRIERCLEDQKGEVGLDHYEGRRWIGLKRRGKNPEITLCQVHTAVAALLRACGLPPRSAAPLIAQAAKEITWTQKRKTQARQSHTKATRRKLRRLASNSPKSHALFGTRLSAVVLI
ncbi:MAG: hypothetical protein HY000_05720 [Planctomycetes bacterium]|nr:hypothetical protein [Planctomycetota bacterium]